MNEIYETAKFWKSWGIATIPIAYGSKQPKVKWLPYTEQLPTDSELQNWYGNTQSNIAIVTGWQDLCILDFDDEEKLMTWRMWVDDEARVHHNMLPTTIYKNTRIHHTSRGYHVLVLCEGAENMKLPKLDILANRKYAPFMSVLGHLKLIINCTNRIKCRNLNRSIHHHIIRH